MPKRAKISSNRTEQTCPRYQKRRQQQQDISFLDLCRPVAPVLAADALPDLRAPPAPVQAGVALAAEVGGGGAAAAGDVLPAAGVDWEGNEEIYVEGIYSTILYYSALQQPNRVSFLLHG